MATKTLTRSMTYAQLVSAIDESTLRKGESITITDFATVHYMVDGNGDLIMDTQETPEAVVNTGVNEPLTVTATSANTIDCIAKSTLYPQDLIIYDWNPANWLEDKSFGGDTIIDGFKGVIYFRHDTLLDNYTGYDFRNVKFRRWKTDTLVWDNSTTYSINSFVNYSGYIYCSLVANNLNNLPGSTSSYWTRLLNLSQTEYWNNNPTSVNGLASDETSFDDFKTFSEGIGDASYSRCCRSNHFGGFKDNSNDQDIYGSILSNNVFFLHDNGYYQIFSNQISSENFGNTIANNFLYNSIGSAFYYNLIGDNFKNNNIGASCHANIIGDSFSGNSLGSYFYYNIIGRSFVENTIGSNVNLNVTAYNFFFNTIQNNLASNIIGQNCSYNSIGNNFVGHKIGDGFKENNVSDNLSSATDFTSATHIYNNYSCKLLKTSTGTYKLKYIDGSDNTEKIVDATA